MTTEAEIQRIDARVTRLETSVFEKLDSIDNRLGGLAVAIASKRDCPDPGACLGLAKQLSDYKDLTLQHANRIARIERWQYGVMAIVGAMSIVGPAIVGLAGLAIKAYFKL